MDYIKYRQTSLLDHDLIAILLSEICMYYAICCLVTSAIVGCKEGIPGLSTTFQVDCLGYSGSQIIASLLKLAFKTG
jgi:hypothetical protein